MSIDSQTIKDGYKKYPVLYICGVIGVVMLAGIYFRFGLIEEQQTEVEKISAVGKRYTANITNASQLEDQVTFLKQANAAVRARGVRPSELALINQYFYRLEAETGIKMQIGASPPSAPIKGSNFVPVNYSLTVEGDYQHIIGFLRRLEQGTHFARVNNASLAVSPVTSLVVLKINIDLLGLL